MSLRRRTFPEVLENLLTAIAGGVAAESHPFPPPGANGSPYRHDLLQQPVADVVSVYGSRDGQPHLFRKGEDYALLDEPQRRTIQWQQDAQLPDPGTLVEVNYYPEAAEPVLTDLYTGSVVRTLSESIALEIASLYAQLEAVYRSAFVDTASGSALDNVVALLGIERVAGGRPAGELEFTRSRGSRGIINIPAGTLVTTSDGNVGYATTQSVTLAQTQNIVRVVARDLEQNDPLPAGSLTVLSLPIAGIASVTNPAPTAITTRDETDDELRSRAKNFLHGSERATLAAIMQAVAREGVTADVVESGPGRVEITPHAERMPPELQQRLLRAIEESRPAGVLVTLREPQPPRKVNLELRLSTVGGLLEQDLRAAQRAVRAKIEDYFARLPAREAGSVNRIVGLVLSVPEVEDVRILSATSVVNGVVEDVLDTAAGELRIGGFPTGLGDLHIADPNLPTLFDVAIIHPQGADPPDAAQIRTALNGAVAYLNDLNAAELPPAAPDTERARRSLSYGKLLYVISLPVDGKPTGTLQEYDAALAAGTAPALPDETAVAPYGARFVFTLESGLSRILSRAADPDYALTPFERLSLGSVEIQAEAAGG